MPKNTVHIQKKDEWSKVLQGLEAAGISQWNRLVVEFQELNDSKARSIMDLCSYSWTETVRTTSHQEVGRKMFRAFNVLYNLKREDAPAENLEYKSKFNSAGADHAELIELVKKAWDANFSNQAQISIPAVQQTTVIIAPPPTNPPSSVIKSFESPNPFQVALQNQIKKMEHAREWAVHDLVQNNNFGSSDWSTAREEIRNVFQTNKDEFLFNFTNIRTSLAAAYGHFNSSMSEYQDQAVNVKKTIALLCFKALKEFGKGHLPLVGTLGEWAVGQFKQDMPRTERQYMVDRGQNDSEILRKIKIKFNEAQSSYAEFTRLGGSMASFPPQEDLSDALDKVAQAQLTILNKICGLVVNEVFGTSENQGSILDGHREEWKKTKGYIDGSSKRGFVFGGPPPKKKDNTVQERLNEDFSSRELLEKDFSRHITNYKVEVLKQIRNDFGVTKASELHNSTEMAEAIKMLLYCQFIICLYGNGSEEAQTNNIKSVKLPNEGEVISFFSQQGGWGILRVDSTHEDAAAYNRLSWKNGEDHRRVLLMFSNWYAANINPFVLITGARLKVGNRDVATPESIKVCIQDEISRINESIDGNREKGWFGSTWDWPAIKAEYLVKSAFDPVRRQLNLPRQTNP
jgi:hypothetical protein